MPLNTFWIGLRAIGRFVLPLAFQVFTVSLILLESVLTYDFVSSTYHQRWVMQKEPE